MAYSVEKWAKVKADYLSGSYSYKKLVQKYSITEAAIVQRSLREGWEKGKHKDVIEAKQQANMIDKFAEIGYGEKDALEDVRRLIKESPKDGLNYYFKLVGTFAPVKRELTGKDGENLIPSKMSEEELDKRIKSMIA